MPFITVGEKVAEFIILRFGDHHEAHYFEIFERPVFPHATCSVHVPPTRTPILFVRSDVWFILNSNSKVLFLFVFPCRN